MRSASEKSSDVLAHLQRTIDSEIPMCRQIGIRVESYDADGLTMSIPLAPNRNHQQTGFAGSLNALCTIAGWGTVFLLMEKYKLEGTIVIHRSSIKYLKPAYSANIYARCHRVSEEDVEHFVEMFQDKGQAKLNLQVKIESDEETAVSFTGCYVVLGEEKVLP